MGVIADEYEDLDTDVPLEEFREAVEDKVEQMGGLADEETAAKLIAHELKDEEVNGIADIEPGMDEVKFLGKVVSIGELRTFERDGEDEEDGRVVNLEVADETGQIRVSMWDRQAVSAVGDPETDQPGELDVGDVLRIAGRPKEGYNGVEVSVDKAEPDEEAEVDVDLQDSYRVEDLSLGLSDVNLRGQILDVGSVRTFDRDDGSEGQVSNLSVGDPTGRIRVTLWDDKAPLVDEFTDDPIWVAGSGLSVDSFERGNDESLVGFPATEQAAGQAHEQAGITADDIDVAEVHDCFPITELVTYEDLGFCEKGDGGAFIDSGEPLLDGETPVNPSGGLLAKGHPIGATGVAQVNEIYEQLRGKAGAVQADNDPEYGLQHNIGIGRNATGSVSCVNILSRQR